MAGDAAVPPAASPAPLPPEPPAARPPRRRALWWLLVPLLGLPLALAGGAAWLAGSEAGSAWLLARLPGVEVVQPRGRLAGGAFAAQRVSLQASSRTLTIDGLAWRDLQWRWRPHDGAWLGLSLQGVQAARLDIGAAADTARAPSAAPHSLRLPLAVTVDTLSLGTLAMAGQPLLHALRADDVALADAQGRSHRIGALQARTDRVLLQGQARIDSDAPFAVQAQLRASALPDAPQPWQAQLEAGGPLAALAVSATLTSPQAAGAQAQAQATVSPFAAWPLSALQARLSALDLSALSAQAPRTQLSGQATVQTQGLDQPMSASVRLDNAEPGRWDEQRLPLAAVELDIAGRPDQRDRLVLRRFELRAPGDGGRASGQGEWRGGTLTLDLTLHALRPSRLDRRAPAMTLGGTLGSRWLGLPAPDGSVAAAPTLQLQSRLALDGTLDAGRSGAAPVRLQGALGAQRTGQAWRVELHDAQARAGEATLSGNAVAERATDGTQRLVSQGQAQGFDPSAWWATAAPARLNGRWQADVQAAAGWRPMPGSVAPWLALRGRAELELTDSAVAGVPLQGTLRATPAPGGGWQLDAQARAADNRALLQGRLAPRAEDDRWTAEVDAPTLAALRPLLAALAPRAGMGALDGALTAQVRGEGRWPQTSSSGSLRASALQVGGLAAAQLQAQWQAAARRDAPLLLELDAQRLSQGTLLLDTLRARVTGTLGAHRIEADATSALRPPAWTDTVLASAAASGSVLRLRGDGRWQGPAGSDAVLPGQWQGRVAELDARGRGATLPWLAARDLSLQLALDAQARLVDARALPGSARVLDAPLTWREARWLAADGVRPMELTLDAELQPLTIAPWLQRWAPQAGFGGDLAVRGRAVVQRGSSFQADLVLERASGDLSVTAEGTTQALGLTDLRLALAANQGTWHFTQALAGANLGVLAGAQTMRVAPDATWPADSAPMQGVLEWVVSDLGVWAPLTPPGWRVGGRLRTSAVIGGRFGAPEIEGRMDGSGLAVRNLLQGVDMRDGTLAVSLRGPDARIERFELRGGEGTLRVTGGASLGDQPRATVQLQAERFRVLGRADRRIVASGRSTLALDARSLALDGQLRIDEGLIDVSRGDAPALDGDVTVRGGRYAADRTPDPATEATTPAPRGTPRELRVAVQLDLGDALHLVGRGIDTRLAGRLNVTAPGGRLALDGQVRAVDGQYAAYGQKLAIQRGVLAFSGAVDNPRLDILAVRPNLDVEVGVLVSGTAQAPRVRLVSTPEMSDYDKLAWLVVGRAPEGLGGADTAILQRAALALLAGEGQSPDAQLLSRLGLDEFSLRQADNGEVRDTVVSLGKQLSRRWYVGYERSVNATTGSWQLIYRVAQRFTLRAQSGADNSLDAIWTWRWN